MNNSEATHQKRTVGKPKIEGLIDKLLHLDAEDCAWFMARYKSQTLPDGTKDSMSAAIRRLMRAHREEQEKNDLYAAQKAGKL
jgi:hypothetical protein